MPSTRYLPSNEASLGPGSLGADHLTFEGVGG